MSSRRRLARVRRLDCRGECLLVRVKLARGSTKANGRVWPAGDLGSRPIRRHNSPAIINLIRSKFHKWS